MTDPLAARLRHAVFTLSDYFWDDAPQALRMTGAINEVSAVADAFDTPPAIDPEAERAYVKNYISGRDAALRSALIARVGDAVGRNAAADIVDAAWRAALGEQP